MIKNSFAANVHIQRKGPNNTSYYDHIGYLPDKTEPRWKKEVLPTGGITGVQSNQPPFTNGTYIPPIIGPTGSTIESTRASSAPTSDNTRDRPSIYRLIVKDNLKIFDDTDIDNIVE